jgi:hypothetical protein
VNYRVIKTHQKTFLVWEQDSFKSWFVILFTDEALAFMASGLSGGVWSSNYFQLGIREIEFDEEDSAYKGLRGQGNGFLDHAP